LMANICVALWGTRLAGFLFHRILQTGVWVRVYVCCRESVRLCVLCACVLAVAGLPNPICV
jgi:hypothetical protein